MRTYSSRALWKLLLPPGTSSRRQGEKRRHCPPQCVCVCIFAQTRVRQVSTEVRGPLKMELPMVVNGSVWVLGTKPLSSASALSHLPSPHISFVCYEHQPGAPLNLTNLTGLASRPAPVVLPFLTPSVGMSSTEGHTQLLNLGSHACPLHTQLAPQPGGGTLLLCAGFS